ncbi:MAG: hypothetical protein ACP5EP_02580 [Acidobacteriaceae bacterium]
MLIPIFKAFVLTAGTAVLLSTTACTVQDKKSGGEDTVRIRTLVGGLDVHTNDVHPADVGLPVYPGAVLAPTNGKDNDKSADVDMSFVGWRLRVRVLNYQSSDAQDKVAAFYQKALGSYGDVLTCQGNKAVGTLVRTRDGLTCSDDHNYNVNIDVESNKGHDSVKEITAQSNAGDLELRAGSPNNQHIVAFTSPAGAGTRFALINVELPHGHETN